jgi:hypothetical protein
VALLDEVSPQLRESVDRWLDPSVRRHGASWWMKALACGGLWRVAPIRRAAPAPQPMAPVASATPTTVGGSAPWV